MNLPDTRSESRINRLIIVIILLIMLLLSTGLAIVMRHKPSSTPTWRIAITNWPGFDPLYISEKKGFFNQQGLDIELVPINSIPDMRTAFERGIIDGYMGTVMEAVESENDTNTPNRIVLVTDYSTGGDQLLTDPSITTLAELKNKRLGLESTSPLSRYIIGRALSGTTVTQAGLNIIPYNQSILIDHAIRGNLDAVITYEPYTSEILAKRKMHELFSSADLPEEILSGVMVSPAMLDAEPELSSRLQHAWQAGLDYIAAHPDESHEILAARYKMDIATYRSMLNEIHILNRTAIQRLTSSKGINKLLMQVSQVLYPASPFTEDRIGNMVAIWYQQEAR